MKILRTMGILAVVAGLVLATGGAVLAQEPELAEIEGVIHEIDIYEVPEDGVLGTVTIGPEDGDLIPLKVIEELTEVMKNGKPAQINDLAVDDEVEALYNPETLEAVKIVAKSPEPAETPEPEENGGRAGDRPEPGPHSPAGKRGLSGNVTDVEKIHEGEEYVIELKTMHWGTVNITANLTFTKYMMPRETHGSANLTRFLEIVDKDDDGNLEELAEDNRRLAVLVTDFMEYTTPPTATAIRLMLIPSPVEDLPPLHAHRVGVVDTFTEGTSITIIDRDGELHTFTLNGGTVYRPAKITAGDIAAESHVTVVSKGHPKLGPVAKAIVLHEELPDWWPLP